VENIYQREYNRTTRSTGTYNMRLRKHLNESGFMTTANWEALKADLDKKCKPYIKELKGAKSLLIRGVAQPKVPQFMTIRSVRKDRNPRLIDTKLHMKLGKLSKELFGWNIRSEGLFTTKSEIDVRMWGKPVIIFPIGNFKYVWKDDVTELYKQYDSWNPFGDNENIFELDIEPEIRGYHTDNLNKYLRMPAKITSECIINCNTYYSINMKWYQTLLTYYGK